MQVGAVAAIQPLPYFVAAASEDVEMAACQTGFCGSAAFLQHCKLHPTFGVACCVEVAQQLYCLLRTEAAAPVPRLHVLLRFLAACPARSQHPLINGCWPCKHAVPPWDCSPAPAALLGASAARAACPARSSLTPIRQVFISSAACWAGWGALGCIAWVPSREARQALAALLQTTMPSAKGQLFTRTSQVRMT